MSDPELSQEPSWPLKSDRTLDLSCLWRNTGRGVRKPWIRWISGVMTDVLTVHWWRPNLGVCSLVSSRQSCPVPPTSDSHIEEMRTKSASSGCKAVVLAELLPLGADELSPSSRVIICPFVLCTVCVWGGGGWKDDIHVCPVCEQVCVILCALSACVQHSYV